MQDLAVALVDCEMQTESASRRKSLAKLAKLAKFGKTSQGWVEMETDQEMFAGRVV